MLDTHKKTLKVEKRKADKPEVEDSRNNRIRHSLSFLFASCLQKWEISQQLGNTNGHRQKTPTKHVLLIRGLETN